MSVSKSKFALKLHLGTHVATEHAVRQGSGVAQLERIFPWERGRGCGARAMEDDKGEELGGENIPSVLPAQHGPLGVGSPAPSLSHCGSALSSAVAASTW